MTTCTFKKSVGKKWNMRHRFTSDILAPCENKGLYSVTVHKKDGRKEAHVVCGVHRNVIQRRANMFGWDVSIAQERT